MVNIWDRCHHHPFVFQQFLAWPQHLRISTHKMRQSDHQDDGLTFLEKAQKRCQNWSVTFTLGRTSQHFIICNSHNKLRTCFFCCVLVTNMSQNHLQFYHFTVPFIFLPKAPSVLFRLLPSAIWFYGIRTCGSPLIRSCRGQNKSSRGKWKYYQEVGGEMGNLQPQQNY